MYKVKNKLEVIESHKRAVYSVITGLSLDFNISEDIFNKKITKIFNCMNVSYEKFTTYFNDDYDILIIYNNNRNDYFVLENSTVYTKEEFERYLKLLTFL